jgi:transposase InsO family protein
VFFAFVVDVWSRPAVGWQLAPHMRTDLVLDALRTALARRRSGADVELVRHSDAGSQGGFKRSSQRSIERGCDGPEHSGLGACWSAGDALAGASAGRTAGASAAVLEGNR